MVRTCTLNLLTVINIYIIFLLIHTTLKSRLSLPRLSELVRYAVQRKILKIMNRKWNHWFREFPGDLISSEMKKFKFSNLRLKGNDKNHSLKGIPLVVTYYPLLKSLSAIIDKKISILYMGKDLKSAFTPEPMVSICSDRNLNSYLGRVKLYPLERTVDRYKC